MARVLIVYYSRGGKTRRLAEWVQDGVVEAGSQCDLVEAGDADVDMLPDADAVILGSPTYYGGPASELKKFIDESIKYHGKLAGKAGGAFATCATLGGGVETTVRALLDALLIHEMIIQGRAHGPHYGPVCIGEPDEGTMGECRQLGKQVAELAETVKT